MVLFGVRVDQDQLFEQLSFTDGFGRVPAAASH